LPKNGLMEDVMSADIDGLILPQEPCECGSTEGKYALSQDEFSLACNGCERHIDSGTEVSCKSS
jgi:hypothetical protein